MDNKGESKGELVEWGWGVEVYNISYTRKFSVYKMKVTKWCSVSCERIAAASESW